MEATLNRIPHTDVGTWRALYLCSHQPRFWEVVAFHTGEIMPRDDLVPVATLAKTWLLPPRYYHHLQRRFGSETKIRPHQALAVLARTDYNREQLRELVVEDLQRQLVNQGVFGVKLIEESHLRYVEGVTARYHIYRLGLRKLILPGILSLDFPSVRLRLQGYELISKLEFCYFRQIIDPARRRYLITTFSGWPDPVPLLTLGSVLLGTPENEGQRRWRDSLLSVIRSLLARYGDQVVFPNPANEEEKLFLRDLVIRTFTERGVNEHYLITVLQERYRH